MARMKKSKKIAPKYSDSLKDSIREFLKGINNIEDLHMLYGMARAACRDKETQKGGAK